MSPDKFIDRPWGELSQDEKIEALRKRAIENRANVHAARRANYILYVCVAILITILVAVYVNDNHRISAQALATCRIQARGLPANKHLAAAMGDIAFLLSLPRAPSAVVIPARIEKRITDLVKNSAAYAAVQARQPTTRNCG